MLKASCHCGNVTVKVPGAPRSLTSCNCSICHRYGALWAYFPIADVQKPEPVVASDEYEWGEKNLRFVRCGICGCLMYWTWISPPTGAVMGVNARNLERKSIAQIPIVDVDGASA